MELRDTGLNCTIKKTPIARGKGSFVLPPPDVLDYFKNKICFAKCQSQNKYLLILTEIPFNVKAVLLLPHNYIFINAQIMCIASVCFKHCFYL